MDSTDPQAINSTIKKIKETAEIGIERNLEVFYGGYLLLFYGIGAGVVWLPKGGRTSYWAEVGEHETRNGIVGILLLLGLLGLAIYINN